MKSLELTVVRALELIAAFDALEKDQDWVDVPAATYRRILGERYEHAMILSVCWERYLKGTLHAEILDLYANLPPGAQEREEIKDGIANLGTKPDRRGKKSTPRNHAGVRRRRNGRN